ncbi:hypothetical protein EVAR_103545_1 [Eumeta japonica]|uniref:Uncharacterized protein n=1 Tax=Eumeta variegata TaxID=151549 RepID=A0A4C1YIT2_EUMVA|nr:hypothetical protein EVAR_103545_1 [Eumeta japonica]
MEGRDTISNVDYNLQKHLTDSTNLYPVGYLLPDEERSGCALTFHVLEEKEVEDVSMLYGILPKMSQKYLLRPITGFRSPLAYKKKVLAASVVGAGGGCGSPESKSALIIIERATRARRAANLNLLRAPHVLNKTKSRFAPKKNHRPLPLYATGRRARAAPTFRRYCFRFARSRRR